MNNIKTINSFCKTIREFILESTSLTKNDKLIIKSSLYVLEDTQLTIDLYRKKNIIVENQSNWLDDKAKNYILIYGILQAMYIQQDSIINICETIKICDKSIILNNNDILYIRNLRNSCTGHPSNNRNKSNNFISQTSLSQYSFSYLAVDKDKSEVIEINILDLIEKQNKNINSILDKIVSYLTDNIMKGL